MFLSYRCAYSSSERRQFEETKNINVKRSLFAATKSIYSSTSILASSASLIGLQKKDTSDDDDKPENKARYKKVIAGGGGALVEERIEESIIRFTNFLYSSLPREIVPIKRVATNSTTAANYRVRNFDPSPSDCIVEPKLINKKTIDHVTRFSLLLIELVLKDRSNSDFFHVPDNHRNITETQKIVHDVDGEKKYMLKCDPSYIALAAILTAFESLSRDILPQIYRQYLVDEVFRIHKIDCTTPEVYEIRVKLRSLFHEMQERRRTHVS